MDQTKKRLTSELEEVLGSQSYDLKGTYKGIDECFKMLVSLAGGFSAIEKKFPELTHSDLKDSYLFLLDKLIIYSLDARQFVKRL